MTRKKVKLMWIANDASRKASLKKRRSGLLKKAWELGTLCGVPLCVIVYSPEEASPVVWPSPEMTRKLVERYFSLTETERTKRAVNHETYLREKVTKVHEQLVKTRRANVELKMSKLVGQIEAGNTLDEFCMGDLYAISLFCQQKCEEIRRYVTFLHQQSSLAEGDAHLLAPRPVPHREPQSDNLLGGTVGRNSLHNMTEPPLFPANYNVSYDGPHCGICPPHMIFNAAYSDQLGTNMPSSYDPGRYGDHLTNEENIRVDPFGTGTQAPRRLYDSGSLSSLACIDQNQVPNNVVGDPRGRTYPTLQPYHESGVADSYVSHLLQTPAGHTGQAGMINLPGNSTNLNSKEMPPSNGGEEFQQGHPSGQSTGDVQQINTLTLPQNNVWHRQ